MTTTLYQPNPSLFAFNKNNITYNNQGIDSISFISRYEMTIKQFEKMGFTPTGSKGTPLSKQIENLKERASKDNQNRYKKDETVVTYEVYKTTKGSSLSSYIIVERNTPRTMNYSTHHKKPKGTYCIVHLMGLHQPTKKLHNDAIAVISDIWKRKRFTLYSYDLATDIKDQREVNSKRKESFKKQLLTHTKQGVISTGSSLYINNPIEIAPISRILLYDKFYKQTRLHKQSLSLELREWKRVEITITIDITKKLNRVSAKEYFKSSDFIDILSEVNDIVGSISNKGYKYDYLNYQINSLLDQRIINNKESKKQFNSVEALERFNKSDFRVFELGLLI